MNAVVQNFYLPPGTLIAYDGYQVIVTAQVREGLAVRDRFVGDDETPRFFVISQATLNQLFLRQDVDIDTEFSADAPAKATSAWARKDAFFDADPEDRCTALMKEAWCLAAQSVLRGGPYFPGLIEKNMSAIKEKAFERIRIAGLNQKNNGFFVAKVWGARSISDFCKAYFGMQNPHPYILMNQKSGGNTNSRLTLQQNTLLDKCVEAYLSKAKPSKKSIVRFVERAFRTARRERIAAGNLAPLPTPHQNTVYARLSKFNDLQLVIAREGYREAVKQFSPSQHGVRALKPGEIIEIDFWKGDIFTLTQQSRFWDLLSPDLQKSLKEGTGKGKKKRRQRLFVCIAIDVATRMRLGLCISETANVRTVLDTLDMVMRDKSKISQLAGCILAWSQRTGLGTVLMDTGPEFFNEEVQTAILAAGGSYVYGRAGIPADKAFCERNFGSLRTMLVDGLPGKTGHNHDLLVDYDSRDMVVFNCDEFRELLIRHAVDHYPLESHKGLFGKRPIDAWRDSQKYGVVAPPDMRKRRNATGVKLERILSKEGIRILGIPFGDPSLFPRHIAKGKRTVEVRVDPWDLSEVTIILDQKQIHLENQREDLKHHSMRTLMAAIQRMRASKPEDKDFYAYVLARHVDWVAQRIELGVQKRGLPATDISVLEVEQFERNYCLGLQVKKSPQQVRSANMDDVLAGRAGPGIYTADDIAREKDDAVRTAEAISESEEPTGSDIVENHADWGVVAQDGEGVEKNSGETAIASLPDKKPHKRDVRSRSGQHARYSGKPRGKGTFT